MPSQDNGGEDARLVQQLRQRNPDALAVAYDRYGSVAYSLFLRITHDQSTAEDLVQELFIRVWNRARDFDAAKGALGVWILAIARHMAIDHMRSAQARFALRLQPLENLDRLCFANDVAEPESVIDRVRTVNTAFSNLNSNEKRVLEMAYFEGLSQSEIATQLAEPLGTVKSRMRSALGRLRKVIKAEASE